MDPFQEPKSQDIAHATLGHKVDMGNQDEEDTIFDERVYYGEGYKMYILDKPLNVDQDDGVYYDMPNSV